MTLPELKARLRRVRLARADMTPKSMAEVAGVSPRTIQRYDDPSDRTEPGLLTVVKVCRAYGLSLDWLVYGETNSGWASQHNRFQATWQHLDTMLTDEQKGTLVDALQIFMDIGIDNAKETGDIRK